jgi:hypothetical protein
MQARRFAITDTDMVRITHAIGQSETEVKHYLTAATAQLVLVPRHRATAISHGILDDLLLLKTHPNRNAVARTMMNVMRRAFAGVGVTNT